MTGLKAFLQGGFSGCLETGKDHTEQFMAFDGNYDEEVTYRYNKITYELRFSDKPHYSLATHGILHSFTLQTLCVIFSISKQTANIFVTVQFASPRNSCDNIVRTRIWWLYELYIWI
jgi:hypothetical protein